MITLLLDSTYKYLSIGLAKDNEMIDEIVYEAWQKQSEYMVQEIDNILRQNSILPKDVNEVIVTDGPGSYTGVRIALTIAKVYCYALKINCYVLSSLKVLEKKDSVSVCIINARSNRSYIGVYKNNETILKDQIFTNDKTLQFILEHPDYIVCGDAQHLNIKADQEDILKNMLRLKSKDSLVKDIFTLKAVYLKD